MSKRILLVQAHPDASQPHFGHGLEASYANMKPKDAAKWLGKLERLGAGAE